MTSSSRDNKDDCDLQQRKHARAALCEAMPDVNFVLTKDRSVGEVREELEEMHTAHSIDHHPAASCASWSISQGATL